MVIKEGLWCYKTDGFYIHKNCNLLFVPDARVLSYHKEYLETLKKYGHFILPKEFI